MNSFVLTIWLTTGGPEITMAVPDCDVGKVWYQQAVRWAERSGVPTNEPGWMCAPQSEQFRYWSAKR